MMCTDASPCDRFKDRLSDLASDTPVPGCLMKIAVRNWSLDRRKLSKASAELFHCYTQ